MHGTLSIEQVIIHVQSHAKQLFSIVPRHSLKEGMPYWQHICIITIYVSIRYMVTVLMQGWPSCQFKNISRKQNISPKTHQTISILIILPPQDNVHAVTDLQAKVMFLSITVEVAKLFIFLLIPLLLPTTNNSSKKLPLFLNLRF